MTVKKFGRPVHHGAAPGHGAVMVSSMIGGAPILWPMSAISPFGKTAGLAAFARFYCEMILRRRIGTDWIYWIFLDLFF